jgi:hypothetical protein
MTVNDIEREAIILNSAWKMIDGMVNWSMFVKNDSAEPIRLIFRDNLCSQLFIIFLGDFLSQIGSFKGKPVPLGLKEVPSNACLSDLTFLFHLRQVCATPKLGNATNLSVAIEAFAEWLEGDFVAPSVNLHTIRVVTDLKITRYRYIKMCGDIAKHNPARLETNVRHLSKLLNEAGHSVSEQSAYLAVEDFFEWFYDDIFNHHYSQIAEFLNNIRLEVFDYLQPEFQRSMHLTENASPISPGYSYYVPTDIREPFAYNMYWDVMNRVRSGPLMHRFVVEEFHKKRY